MAVPSVGVVKSLLSQTQLCHSAFE